MNWKPFDYRNFENGLFWLLTEGSVDQNIDSTPAERRQRKPVLSWVESEPDGSPWFIPAEYANLGYVEDGWVVTHFAPVIPPALPEQQDGTHNIDSPITEHGVV
ncbi:TPA: hypothetical protein I8273_004641 [Aeromonas hydrophila]|nr:hypothetical protein [Aeromonas hydrophila]HAT2639103.1 hypothetical protein [Aeromonas hydrophila]HAT3424267.1 hypothetical protein [Aeromonas hydrophila]HAT3534265.1 hypothetical protein [Aeromonas hydrophila]